MARVKSILEIQGRIGDLIIARTPNGGKRAYLKSSKDWKKYFRESPNASNTRRTASNFGGISSTASGIYFRLQDPDDTFWRPYAHNHILKRILAEFGRTGPSLIRRIAPLDYIPALMGIELGHEGNPGRNLHLLPIGPRHAPEAVHIQGLHQAAAAISPHQYRTQLLCRVTTHAIPAPTRYLQDGQWCEAQEHCSEALHQTAWIPMHMIPTKGITVPLPSPADDPGRKQTILHFTRVEWQLVQPRKRPKFLHQKASIRYLTATLNDADRAQAGQWINLSRQARRRYKLTAATQRRAHHERPRPSLDTLIHNTYSREHRNYQPKPKPIPPDLPPSDPGPPQPG